MKAREIRVRAAADLELFGHVWESEQPARALVLITHGHGEHSGRYANVGQALSQRGFSVVGLDLRGHGRSGGGRGLLMDWDEFRDDMRKFIEAVTGELPGIPTFLYGHSVGGTLSLDYAMRSPSQFAGVIASAPALGQPNIPAILFQISRLLSRIYPTFTMATQLEVKALSRDPEVVQAYQEDPLVHSRGSARMGTELLKTAEWIQAHAEEWTLPLLLIHGLKDRLVNPEDSRRFFENVVVQDKAFLELPEGFHEPHNDFDQAFVLTKVGDWIEAHIQD